MLPTTYPFKSTADIDAFEAYTALMARERFHVFRRLMRPKMKWGWFPERLSLELQRFYVDFISGKRPKLALCCPPQHGKSIAAEDFISWIAGKHPEWKTIYASYSDELGIYRNDNFQRMVKSPQYKLVFPRFEIDKPGWTCNKGQVDYCGYDGSFRNTTVNGSINGFEIHLGVLDDPVKGRKEALSKTISDGTWNWFADDWLSRFSNESAQLIIMTRWALDDVVGRYKDKAPNLRIVEYPAIAEKEDRYRKEGDPLFPALKDLRFLQDRKTVMVNSSWVSEYQQHPIAAGGGMFPIQMFRILPIFDPREIVASVRGVDKAGCFVAGTMVATEFGDVPIESIKPGVRVWTRKGLRQVKRAWLTKHVNELVSVRFQDGTELVGTPDHRIWTNAGWKPLATLGEGAYTSCLSIERQPWRKVKLFGLKGFVITVIRTALAKVVRDIFIAMRVKPFTGKYGAQFMATYPMVVTSITLTTTGTTICRTIWSASREENITPFTDRTQSSRVRCATGMLKIMNGFKSLSCGLHQNLNRMYARIAVVYSSQGVTKQNFASKYLVDALANRVSIFVGNVRNHFADLACIVNPVLLSVFSGNANGAAMSLQDRSRQSAENIVPRVAEPLLIHSGNAHLPVYDIEVEGEHEFFANGVLVHNSQDGGAYTAFVLIHKMRDGRFVIENVIRHQWEFYERERHLRNTIDADWHRLRRLVPDYKVAVEVEPGSGGKESATSTVRNLAGYNVVLSRPTGSKELRAEPLSAQVAAGNVWLVAGPWIADFLAECESFPNSRFKDQVDSAALAFNTLSGVAQDAIDIPGKHEYTLEGFA